MLRLTKSGKRKYVSLGVSVKEENWDFSKNCTRADFYTFLWNAAGAPAMSVENPFSDVTSTGTRANVIEFMYRISKI